MYLMSETKTVETTTKGGQLCASSPNLHGTDTLIASSEEDVTGTPSSSITPPRVAEVIVK